MGYVFYLSCIGYNMSKWILGLGGAEHDFSAALMLDQDIRVAIEQERLSRRKYGVSYWYENPVGQAINYCLTSEGIKEDDIDMIVASDVLPSRARKALEKHKLRLFPHHLCHAASAYMMLQAGAIAGVIVYDGYGSVIAESNDSLCNTRETVSFYLFDEVGYTHFGGAVGLGNIEMEGFPPGATNSIGMLYELITGLLGFNPWDSGKTMGLSSYGTPCYLNIFENFVEFDNKLFDCFRCDTSNQAFISTIEQILLKNNYSFKVKADIAASLQTLMNKTLLHFSNFFTDLNIDFLLISGGCGLNTVANSFLVENSPLNVPIVIPPHCGDAGLALGALWLAQYNRHEKVPKLTFNGGKLSPSISRPGRVYKNEERHQAVQQFYPRLVHDWSITTAYDVAKFLSDGNIIAVLNGRSEIGPRALGGRSILASPNSAFVREKINRLMKQREPFRPFAPMVLRVNYEKYFHDVRCVDQFMLKTSVATDQCFRDAPAIVHIDGTARVQVIETDGDPFLVALLRSFQEISGIGLILNTSFNRKGEPIVETPFDAIDAFLGMGLDGLFMDGEFYRPATSRNPNI